MLTLKQRGEKLAKKKQERRRANKELLEKQVSSKWHAYVKVIAGILTFLFAGYLSIEFRNIVIDIKWLLLSAAIYCLPVILFCNKSRYYVMYYWFLLAGTFFFFNSLFAQRNVIIIQRPIEHKSYRYKRSGPSAKVTYHRVDLNISCDDDETLAKANYAMLHLSTGLFGIEIVRDSKVIP